MEITFSSSLTEWDGSNWVYVQLSADDSAAIREATSGMPRKGFGSLKVAATIGSTDWETSVFPDSKTKRYIMFIKKSVRQAEGLEVGHKAHASLRLKAL